MKTKTHFLLALAIAGTTLMLQAQTLPFDSLQLSQQEMSDLVAFMMALD